MTGLTDEHKFILIQFFLEDASSEQPIVHSKKMEKRQGALINEIETLIRDYEELDLGVDVIPYKEVVTHIRKIKGKEAYNQFVDDLLKPYM